MSRCRRSADSSERASSRGCFEIAVPVSDVNANHVAAAPALVDVLPLDAIAVLGGQGVVDLRMAFGGWYVSHVDRLGCHTGVSTPESHYVSADCVPGVARWDLRSPVIGIFPIDRTRRFFYSRDDIPRRMKVLLGIGGGDDSLWALEQTVNRAADAGDDLTVAILDDPEREPPVDDIEREVDRALAAAGIDAEIRHVDGDLGSELITIAESEGFDRIAIGGGTTSPMGKIQLGSTAEFVLLNSHVSVSLVR